MGVFWCTTVPWGSWLWRLALTTQECPSSESTSTSSTTFWSSPWRSNWHAHSFFVKWRNHYPHLSLFWHIKRNAGKAEISCKTRIISPVLKWRSTLSYHVRDQRFTVVDYAKFPTCVHLEHLKTEVLGLPPDSFLLHLSQCHTGQSTAMILVPNTRYEWTFSTSFQETCKSLFAAHHPSLIFLSYFVIAGQIRRSGSRHCRQNTDGNVIVLLFIHQIFII